MPPFMFICASTASSIHVPPLLSPYSLHRCHIHSLYTDTNTTSFIQNIIVSNKYFDYHGRKMPVTLLNVWYIDTGVLQIPMPENNMQWITGSPTAGYGHLVMSFVVVCTAFSALFWDSSFWRTSTSQTCPRCTLQQ